MEWSPERVRCAEFVASTLPSNIARPRFLAASVYDLSKLDLGTFDVALCLGGLYHVPDPSYVLDQIRPLVTDTLIVQTSSILNFPGNCAQFYIRGAGRKGWSSITVGRGAWRMTARCFENMLLHAGFSIRDSRRPRLHLRRRYPWYCALCQVLVGQTDPTT